MEVSARDIKAVSSGSQRHPVILAPRRRRLARRKEKKENFCAQVILLNAMLVVIVEDSGCWRAESAPYLVLYTHKEHHVIDTHYVLSRRN